MLNIKIALSRFKENVINKGTNIKNKAKNGFQKFKENFSEAKSKPRSKRKSLFLGFTTVVSIFGVTLFTLVLAAVAKDTLKKSSKVCPAPASKPLLVPSQQITKSLSGAAASICALAISSGSFVIGSICGVIVVVGILKAQGK